MIRLMRAAAATWDGAEIVVVRVTHGWDEIEDFRAEAHEKVIKRRAHRRDEPSATTWLAGQAYGDTPRAALRNLIRVGKRGGGSRLCPLARPLTDPTERTAS